ncbi:MAG: hypothetical protein IT544_02410 [Rhodobacteraceae bacterium]|nr:hypothetical protein [Paracoccaceae bacterium]
MLDVFTVENSKLVYKREEQPSFGTITVNGNDLVLGGGVIIFSYSFSTVEFFTNELGFAI